MKAMEWYEQEVRALERHLCATPLPVRPVVFYGSSSFRLWDRLAHDLGGDPRILNLAFGGSTLESCVHFFDRLVAPANPASLVVYAGDNDLGDGRRPEDVLGWYRDLARKVQASFGPIPFAFLTIKPSPARLHLMDSIRLANRWIAEESARHPGAYLIDVFTPMLNGGDRPQSALFEDDGLHLSPAGYALWTATILAHRNRIFI
jgi:lysophospholipase L1-like esterase